MEERKQIEEMGNIIYKRIATMERFGLTGRESCEKIAEELLKSYQPKIPEGAVVLTREEHEMLVNQYKNLEIKYSNLCDNYRLCKDTNETLKQNLVIAQKEMRKYCGMEVGDGNHE